MGDRFYITKECPHCGEKTDGYYAESCGMTFGVCEHCKKEFKIVMDFKFIKLGQ